MTFLHAYFFFYRWKGGSGEAHVYGQRKTCVGTLSDGSRALKSGCQAGHHRTGPAHNYTSVVSCSYGVNVKCSSQAHVLEQGAQPLVLLGVL